MFDPFLFFVPEDIQEMKERFRKIENEKPKSFWDNIKLSRDQFHQDFNEPVE